MKKVFFLTVVLILAYSFCHAYDKTKAKQYQTLYSKCDGKFIGVSLFMMAPEKFVDKIKNGSEIFVLDVRTEAEENIIGMNLPHVLFVPMNQVFNENSLAKLPKDKPIVVICRKGVRSSLVTMGLHDIGLDNVFSLKGGMKGLIDFLTPKTAN